MKTELRELCVAVVAAATLTGLSATANEPAAGMNMEEMMAMAKAANMGGSRMPSGASNPAASGMPSVL